MFRQFHPLLDKASDDGKGSGGGGGDQPAFTEAQTAELAKIVNAAVTSHVKRGLGPAIAEAIKGVNWGETLKLDEVLDGKLAKLLEDTEGDDAGGKGGQQPAKPDPKVAALEAKLADVTKKLEAEAAERQKAVQEGRDKDARAALRSALTPLVRPEALDIAVRDLFDGQKAVTLDEQGNPLIKVRRKDYAGAEEVVDMPLSDGVGHWIKTNEGKFFAPPPNGGGTDPKGGRGPQRGAPQLGRDGLPHYEQPATTDAEKLRRAEERQAAYLARMNTT